MNFVGEMAEMGTAVWVPHETDVWQPGVIESRTDTKDGGIELPVSLPRAGRVETFQSAWSSLQSSESFLNSVKQLR